MITRKTLRAVQTFAGKLEALPRLFSSFQTSVVEVIDFIQQSPLTGPLSIVSDVVLTTSPTTVSHRLGRVPLGFFVVDSNAGEVVFRSGDMTALITTLQATGNVTVTILFF